MRAAFRSDSSALAFCALLIALLGLPIVNYCVGHPPREQAYAAVSTEAGPVGMEVREIFGKSPDPDLLFLGSSLVRAGIDTPTLERMLSAHLGRPAHVEMLALNWQGLDLQYFLLRDFLRNHRAGLILWNLPVPGSRNLVPHVEAFRWVRFGEYSDALSGLPLQYRFALYSDMVVGAPRELLSHVRPNLLSRQEMESKISPDRNGYYGAGFTPESTTPEEVPAIRESYQDPPYRLVRTTGKPLNTYEDHFAQKIVELARGTHTKIVFLHIPIDVEQGMDYMPERSNWPDTLHVYAPMIGLPSAAIFKGIGEDRIHNFYRDQHFNINGSLLFTGSIAPAVLKAYDARENYE
jgi:hypothetical protein